METAEIPSHGFIRVVGAGAVGAGFDASRRPHRDSEPSRAAAPLPNAASDAAI